MFDAVLNLNDEQQAKLKIYNEDLLAENKRISVRKAYKITISYSIQSRIYSDTIADISKSGLFIETVRSFNIGEEIIMSFNMHGYDRPFKIKGSIVCSNRPRYVNF